MTELEIIEQHTGMKVNSCTCDKCVKMCKTAPCLGTPQDILNLFEAGYGDYIHKTTWRAGKPYGFPDIQMFQIRFDNDRHQCPLLENSRCMLHESGLKPTEGKIADCKVFELEEGKYPPAWMVALSWNFKENAEIVDKVREYYDHKTMDDIHLLVKQWLKT